MINRRRFIDNSLALTGLIILSSFRKKLKFLQSNTEYNVLLGRPTDTSITINLFTNQDATIYINYGLNEKTLDKKTELLVIKANTPVNIRLENLLADNRYYYQVCIQESGTDHFTIGKSHRFHTRKKKKSEFVFTITSDSHLGTLKHCDPELYQNTLNNVAKDEPDLHFALGDDFRTSKIKSPSYSNVEQLYFDQRVHLNTIFHSIPYFFILGNHELEAKAYDNNTADCPLAWSEKARTQFVPNPIPDSFYSGSPDKQNYYAFEWGDVLFVTLDVFRYSDYSAEDEEMKEKQKADMQSLSKEERMKLREERQKNKEDGHHEKNGDKKKKDPWAFSLGKEQYDWLKQTLEHSSAKFKFVLGHHVMGSCRGGVEWAGNFEWGGNNRNGVREFETKRPGWDMPIHELMKKHQVNAFIQGHDHLFARQEKEGIAYITCPMCGDPGYNAYNDDAYLSGDKLSNTGHLRFSVKKNDVVMDYVKATLPKDESIQGKNGSTVYSWSFGKNKKN